MKWMYYLGSLCSIVNIKPLDHSQVPTKEITWRGFPTLVFFKTHYFVRFVKKNFSNYYSAIISWHSHIQWQPPICRAEYDAIAEELTLDLIFLFFPIFSNLGSTKPAGTTAQRRTDYALHTCTSLRIVCGRAQRSPDPPLPPQLLQSKIAI
jgi:hypothetical protein